MDHRKPIHEGSDMSGERWPALMTRQVAAEYLSVSPKTIQRLVADGAFRTRAFSRTGVRICRASVDEWIETLPEAHVMRNRMRRNDKLTTGARQ